MSSTFDLRSCLNAVSDVLINRPAPLREVDQIYMKAGDVLLHADHLSTWFDKRDVVFVGDGDAIALTVVHLQESQLMARGPRSVHVLDFDERIIHSVRRFAHDHSYGDRITATYYNVADPIPDVLFNKFSAFHTNPPFGASNGGASVDVFVRRALEACSPASVGCIVLADDDGYPWTHDVLSHVQRTILDSGFFISELRPRAHQYHLDDAPDLKSCTMLVRQKAGGVCPSRSLPIADSERENFYGRSHPLRHLRIKDLTMGGRLPSQDHKIIDKEEESVE